jgi:hypothetical protein
MKWLKICDGIIILTAIVTGFLVWFGAKSLDIVLYLWLAIAVMARLELLVGRN